MADETRRFREDIIRIILRPIANGYQSIYLQSTNAGKKVDECLHLYLRPEDSDEDKRHNEITLATAQSIRDERMRQYLKEDTDGPALIIDDHPYTLFGYIDKRMDELRSSGGMGMYWHYSQLKGILSKYTSDFPLANINRHFVQSFYNWMCKYKPDNSDTPLSYATIKCMSVTLSGMFKLAVSDGLLQYNPMEYIQRIYEKDTKKRYLEIEELKALMSVPYSDNLIRLMFIFAVHTGFRISDLRNLLWKDVVERDGEMFIEKIVKKSKRPISIPLNKSAQQMLPPRGKEADKVFGISRDERRIKNELEQWAEETGVRKFTFHASRHSFATLNITAGTEIDTVRQMLGHSSVHETHRYAKVIAQRAQQASVVIDELFEKQIKDSIVWERKIRTPWRKNPSK